MDYNLQRQTNKQTQNEKLENKVFSVYCSDSTVCHKREINRISHSYRELIFFFRIFDPLICLPLRIDHQWPAKKKKKKNGMSGACLFTFLSISEMSVGEGLGSGYLKIDFQMLVKLAIYITEHRLFTVPYFPVRLSRSSAHRHSHYL